MIEVQVNPRYVDLKPMNNDIIMSNLEELANNQAR